MIYTEKIRNMNDVERFHYFLKRFVDETTSDNTRQEIIEKISELLKGVKIEEISAKFNVETTITKPEIIQDPKDANKQVFEPAKVIIKVPESDKVFVMDITDMTRKQFRDPVPEAGKRPIKSFLTEEEKKELLADPSVGPRVIK